MGVVRVGAERAKGLRRMFRANLVRMGLMVSVAGIGWACGSGVGDQKTAARSANAECVPDTERWGAAVSRLDSLFASRLRTERVPGIAAGVVCRDQLRWADGYGVYALDDPRPVSPETRFRVASITKLFTASAIMTLALDGRVDLDDPVDEILPWFDIQRPAELGNDPITIRHLLTHTSGLPRDSRLTNFEELFQPTRSDAIAALPSQTLEAAPGESFAYSNLGYAILGEVIRSASGSSYESYLRQALLEPLNMRETLVHPDSSDDTAWGHGPAGADGTREKAGFWELRFATPAGGMASSVVDMSRFMIAGLAPYAGAEPSILSDTAIRTMHDVHFAVDSAGAGMGLGWGIETSDGQHVVYHGGGLPEQTSFLLIDVNGLIGVVVMTNAQDANAGGMAQEALEIVREAVLDSIPQTQEHTP